MVRPPGPTYEKNRPKAPTRVPIYVPLETEDEEDAIEARSPQQSGRAQECVGLSDDARKRG
jgi:hypothetical protein